MSRAGVHVRRARVSDAPALAAVMRAAIRGLARGTYDPGRLAAWSSLPPLYHAWAMTAGGETYLAAERGGRVAGYAALRGREVTAVFVTPSAARRGTGRALLAAVERLARRRAVPALFARAALGAVGFYERAGFRRAGAGRVPLPGGLELPVVTVRKRLDERGRPRPVTGAAARSRRPRSRSRRRGATRARPSRSA